MSEPLGWTVETALVHMTELMKLNQARTEERIQGLRTLMDERDKLWPTRDEIRKEFDELENKIANLQQSRSAGHAERTGLHEQRTDRREDRRIWIAGGAFAVALIALLMQVFL